MADKVKAGKITVYVLRLTDAHDNSCYDVVEDWGDNCCLFGYDENGVYHQFDSYEAYHVSDWAAKRGFTFDSRAVEVDVEQLFNLPQRDKGPVAAWPGKEAPHG
jgi:hypothetical protein